ncbi:MAG: deferrochelatase/peroxidase EfeB, partial [Mycobacterium sp.]|nr:deferrochelatase/peroxidase EfeB [Mycobacterium sp.]
MAGADERQPSPQGTPEVSRRGVLGRALWAGVGGLAVGAAGGGAAGWAQASSVHSDNTDKDAVDLHRSYPFYGQPHP